MAPPLSVPGCSGRRRVETRGGIPSSAIDHHDGRGSLLCRHVYLGNGIFLRIRKIVFRVLNGRILGSHPIGLANTALLFANISHRVICPFSDVFTKWAFFDTSLFSSQSEVDL